ncbi:MAG: alpha/beta hydrolase, partial [archaeon]|nr:alpha/beta hydrolase [archaeon]
KRSWYAYFFIMPLVPELYLKITNRKRLILSMNRSFSEEKLKRYKKAWSQPGAMKAMINWYRCMFLLKKEDRLTKIIEVPTLIIWGKKDKFIKWEMAQDSADLCVNARVEFLEDASHWVLEDESVKTSNLLIEFFSKK